jgi:histone H3/H4
MEADATLPKAPVLKLIREQIDKALKVADGNDDGGSSE